LGQVGKIIDKIGKNPNFHMVIIDGGKDEEIYMIFLKTLNLNYK